LVIFNIDYNQKLQLLIDGKWVSSSNRETMPVVNPANKEVTFYLPIAKESDLDEAIEK